MRKLLITAFFTFIVFTSSVLADTTYTIDYSVSALDGYSYPQMKQFIEDNSDIITDMVESLISTWESDYSSTYPYYVIGATIQETQFDIILMPLDDILSIDISQHPNDLRLGPIQLGLSYDLNNESLTALSVCNSCYPPLYSTNGSQYGFDASTYFFSNFNLTFTGYSDGETIGFENSTYNQEWLLYPTSAPITSGYDFFNLTFLSEFDTDTYTEVNLNDWPYIVLSLKSYSSLISPVEFQVLGQACITPVLNYGTKEKSEITDVCTLPYESFTPVRMYINEDSFNQHVVYYVSAYDTSITNKIKINTGVFSISYITQQNANNPNIEINGRIYPIIPYDDLTNTAEKNEENGYIPGQSVNIFDVSSNSEFITQLFSNPLEALTSVWTAIITMFSLVGSFISLLPTSLQAFLFASFGLGLALGLIKILIGGI